MCQGCSIQLCYEAKERTEWKEKMESKSKSEFNWAECYDIAHKRYDNMKTNPFIDVYWLVII